MPTDEITTHTPGPWTITPYGRIDGPDFPIAEVYGATARVKDVADAENLANARLIAASPDLLAALKDCADVLDNYSDVNDGEDGPVANRAMSMLAEIERVIAKAEGR